ncbi:MAG: T9SS type A sorting domain-containing protein [Polaribacter sp.]
MKTKNYFIATLLFSLICIPLFGQETSRTNIPHHNHNDDSDHVHPPCDEDVIGVFNFPISMVCPGEILITSPSAAKGDKKTGTYIYGNLASDIRIRVVSGGTPIRIIAWEEDDGNTGNAMRTHTIRTRLRNGNMGRRYSHTHTKVINTSEKKKIVPKEVVKIFPNPFKNLLKITSQNHPIVGYQIKDLYGKTIQEETITATYKKVLFVSQLRTGMYILNLYFKDGTQQQKTIIKN